MIRPLILLVLCAVAASAQQPINAATLPGTDAAQQINAADLRLGSAPGTILYQAPSPRQALTPVTLHSNHTLTLASPITWRAAITLPPASTGQSISCPAPQTLTFTAPTEWISASQTTAVSLHDCTLRSSTPSFEVTAIGGGAIQRLSLANNTLTDTQLVSTRSTQSSYAQVTPANSSADLTITGNHGHSSTGKGTFILLSYTNRATVTGNSAENYFYGVYWWGGDSCVGPTCTAGGNGAAENPRRTSALTITANTITATQACIWGSMGQSITITGNTCASAAPNTGDVGIDLEGTQDSSVTGNTIRGFHNGSLATFFLATRNTFSRNIILNTAEAPIGIHNSTQDPGTLTETFTGNTFTCTQACATILEATGNLTLTANHFTNVFLTSASNLSQVTIERNTFLATLPLPGFISISSLTASAGHPGQARVVANQFTSNATQSPTASAISVTGTDFNQPQQTILQDNILTGPHPFPIDITCAAASPNSPAQANTCTVTGNTLATNRILTPAAPHTTVHLIQSRNHQ